MSQSANGKTTMSMPRQISQFFYSVPVLIGLSFIFFCFQIDAFNVFKKYFGEADLSTVSAIAFVSVYTLLWYLAIPAMTTRFVFKDSLKEMGLAFPEKKLKAFILSLLSLLILMPCIFYFTRLPQFHSYALGSPSIPKLVLVSFVLFPPYYLAEEFFFRGFLFLGLWRRVRWHSFWITDIIFTLSHVGKPGLEILLCIPASVVFNVLTLSTRSIFPAVVVHTLMGIMLSVLVTFNLTAVAN